jgi:hypothetical protein
MAKDLFGFEDTRTEEEKTKDGEYYKLLDDYEEKFDEQLCTECIQLSQEQLIKDLKKCLKNNITLDVIYPGINEFDDECDY